jgi:hypothetical protein
MLHDGPRRAPGRRASGAAWTYASASRRRDDDPRDDTRDVNARVILRVNAFGPAPVRRRLEASIGADRALQPGALTLAGMRAP